MQPIVNFIFEHAQYAHWIIFGSLMLAGLNIPISEDLMIIISAILASSVIPKNAVILYLSVFLGAYLSDWMVYWIGRKLGVKLLRVKWFKKTVSRRRLSKIRLFYRKYGFYTLLLGRFIPFGVRNCLFLTAGIIKMNFIKFILSDGIACFLSNTMLFSIAYFLGKNYYVFYNHLKIVHIILFVFFVFTIIGLICYYKKKQKRKDYDYNF